MNVLVLGASGKTGSGVVARALATGHEVTALVHQAILPPAILNDDPATGNVRVVEPETGEKAHKITRADLATFIVAQLTSDDHLGQAITIAYR